MLAGGPCGAGILPAPACPPRLHSGATRSAGGTPAPHRSKAAACGAGILPALDSPPHDRVEDHHEGGLLLGLGLLDDGQAAGAVERLVQLVRRVPGGDHHALEVDAAAARLFEHGAAVQLRHLPVHQHHVDVGAQRRDGGTRVGVRLDGNALAVAPLEQAPPGGALQRRVVDDDRAPRPGASWLAHAARRPCLRQSSPPASRAASGRRTACCATATGIASDRRWPAPRGR